MQAHRHAGQCIRVAGGAVVILVEVAGVGHRRMIGLRCAMLMGMVPEVLRMVLALMQAGAARRSQRGLQHQQGNQQESNELAHDGRSLPAADDKTVLSPLAASGFLRRHRLDRAPSDAERSRMRASAAHASSFGAEWRDVPRTSAPVAQVKLQPTLPSTPKSASMRSPGFTVTGTRQVPVVTT